MTSRSQLVVVWDKLAYSSLLKACEFIRKDSGSNAEKVKNGILKLTRELASNPLKHSADKFKKGNRGEYRAFEKYSYRVAYKVEKKQIIILRVRHVKQEPLAY